jgi:hypothetical protein
MPRLLAAIACGAALLGGGALARADGPTKTPGKPGTTVREPTSDEGPQTDPAQSEPDKPAQPIPFPKGTFYGGGAIGTSTVASGKTTVKGGAQLITAAVSRDRDELNFRGDLLVPCDGGTRVYAFPVAYNVPLSGKGMFKGSAAHRDKGSAGRQDGTWSFSGRFDGVDRAAGTARLTFTTAFADGTFADCDTGKLRWRVNDATQRPGRGEVRRDTGYYGTTAQSKAFALRTNRSGTAIASMALGYRFDPGDCRTGTAGAVLPVGNTPVRIERRRATVTQELAFSIGDLDVTLTVPISARFGRARVSGTLRVYQVVRRHGELVDKCKTGTVAWQAER